MFYLFWRHHLSATEFFFKLCEWSNSMCSCATTDTAHAQRSYGNPTFSRLIEIILLLENFLWFTKKALFQQLRWLSSNLNYKWKIKKAVLEAIDKLLIIKVIWVNNFSNSCDEKKDHTVSTEDRRSYSQVSGTKNE